MARADRDGAVEKQAAQAAGETNDLVVPRIDKAEPLAFDRSSKERELMRNQKNIVLVALLGAMLACENQYAQRQAPAVPQSSPGVVACNGGDSKACNDVGDSLLSQNDYVQARQYFLISCQRIRSDLVGNARRLVALNDGAPSEMGVNAEADEIKARIEGCISTGDSFRDDNASALPYYDDMCKLSSIGYIGVAAGFDSVVGMACDSGGFARQDMARDAAFRAQMGGIFAQGAAKITGTVANGVAKVDAAKHGVVLGDEPTTAAAGARDAQGGASCLDHGASCTSDASVTQWKNRCASNPPNQAPCYCAAVATYKCFIAHSCYQEAGARRADGQPSDTTLAQLQSGLAENGANAQKLGTSCGQ
jgi:hypothetical protein